MKFTIEVTQDDFDIPGIVRVPRVTIAVNGNTIGTIRHVEFEAREDMVFPKAKIEFNAMECEDKGLQANIASSIAYARKLLADFSWIDVP